MSLKLATTLTIFAAVLLCDVTQAESNVNSASCSVKVTVGDNNLLICSNECEADDEPLWFNGIIYKRSSTLRDEINSMVAVKFAGGVITDCTMVPYETDAALISKHEQLQLCLSENETPDLISLMSCPTGFTNIGEQCYVVTPKAMTYGENRKHCKSISGDLASIDNQEEQDEIASVLPSVVYIGMNDKEEEGVFRDVRSRESTFFNWRTGEPNNSGNQDCVLVKPQSGFRWWDIQCNKDYHGLCEAEPVVSENPSCQDGELILENSCYLVTEEAMTYDEGKIYCRSLGGNLAFVNGEKEQDFLAANMETSVLTALSDVKTEGLFAVPYYGLPFYTSWSASSANSDSLDCSILDSSEGFNWTHVDCDLRHRALCEIPSTPVTA